MEDLTNLELLLTGVFFLLLVIQLVYLWGVFGRTAFYKKSSGQNESKKLQPVSVVIAARNEYHRLKENLPHILEQDYPVFEVVVVNHASEDETKSLLLEMEGKYPHLKVVHLEQDLNFFKGKKFPLSIGIKSARHETLLLTDADCRPQSKNWIKSMATSYTDGKEVVLGFGPYRKEKGITNLLIRYDAFSVALNYLSFALIGLPYMGVGRNLSYKKSLFIKNKGFISHYNIASGDDDLFISEVATKQNTGINIDPESFVYSEPKHSLKEWLRQKRRHMTTGKKYKPLIKFLLALYSTTQWLFYLFFITLLVFQVQTMITTGFFAVRLLSMMFVYKKAGNQLNQPEMFVFSLFLEPLYLLLMPIFGVQALFADNKQWK